MPGKDGDRAYDNGANSYIVKPVAFDSLLDALRPIHAYWLKLNTRAPKPEPRFPASQGTNGTPFIISQRRTTFHIAKYKLQSFVLLKENNVLCLI